MRLEQLQIHQVRNLTDIRLQPGPGLNVLTGPNASGKTAVLEAIYLLTRARSFRTPRIQDVISHQQKSLTISAGIYHEHIGHVKTGIEKNYGETTIRLNGASVPNVSSQARQFPVILVSQETGALITGGPRERRHWLDWALFHVEPEYLEYWKHYVKALRQRNSLLKSQKQNKQLFHGWEQTMVEFGMRLTEFRRDYVQAVSVFLAQHLGESLSENVNITFQQGWSDALSLEQVLEEGRAQDRERGYTRTGPHQCELMMTRDGRRIASIYSRGQIKLFLCSLMLAQADGIKEKTGVNPVMMIDDHKAELDNRAGYKLLDKLQNAGYQTFLTTTELDEQEKAQKSLTEFHVEQGKIN